MSLQISPDTFLEALPGVSDVVLLNDDGKPTELRSRGRLPHEWKAGLEEFTKSLIASAKESGKRISMTNQTPYEPLRGWFYAGGDWAVCVASIAHIQGMTPGTSGSSSGFVAVFFLPQHANAVTVFETLIGKTLTSAQP